MLGEQLGQMRAMGTGALARGELAPETRGQLRALRARADEFDAASQASLQRAAQHAPGLTATLAQPLAAEKARVAEALRLARAERHYLFSLAECADPEAGRLDAIALPEGLQDCVDSIRCPAYVLDRCWNVLACNAALLRLFDGWPARGQPNLLRYIFLDPAARTLVVDWEERASRVVAEFRADVAALAGESDIAALVAELQAGSPLFARAWTRQVVVDREGGLREFQHPADGRMRLRQFTFRLAIRPDCKLVMLLDEPGY